MVVYSSSVFSAVGVMSKPSRPVMAIPGVLEMTSPNRTPLPFLPFPSLNRTGPNRVVVEGARYMYRTVKDIRFPLSVRNEVAAMERLLALTKGALAAYPTTLEEDQAALKVCMGNTVAWCLSTSWIRSTRVVLPLPSVGLHVVRISRWFRCRGSWPCTARDAALCTSTVLNEQQCYLSVSRALTRTHALPVPLFWHRRASHRASQNGGLEPFSNRRHALIQVCGEKVVLVHYVDLAETALACLTSVDTAELVSRCDSAHSIDTDPGWVV